MYSHKKLYKAVNIVNFVYYGKTWFYSHNFPSQVRKSQREPHRHQGCARFAEIWLKYFEFHILWSLSSVYFHTLTLQLPIQTPNSVAPELQAFVSSLAISAKRAHPSVNLNVKFLWLKDKQYHYLKEQICAFPYRSMWPKMSLLFLHFSFENRNYLFPTYSCFHRWWPI